MNFPVTITIGQEKILLHTVLEPAAYFIAFRYYLYLRNKKSDLLTSSSRLSVILGAIFGALVGSRILGGFENPQQLRAANNLFIYFNSNKTILGGLLGGLAGVELIKKRIGEKKASGDLFVFPIFLGMIIGRIGCFTMGVFEETYGSVTSVPWAMDLGDGLLRHPVTLYEIALLIITWIGLAWVDKKSVLVNGGIFKIFMIVYCTFRFFLDFIKPGYLFPFGLSSIQIASLGGIIYYGRYILHPQLLRKKTKNIQVSQQAA